VKRQPQVWLESTHTLATRGRGRDGVGHYTEELIAHLAKQDPERTYTVVGNIFATAEPHRLKPRSDNIRFRFSRLFPGKVWNQMFKRGVMPPLNWIIPGRPDLVVFFNFVRYPLTPGVKSIVVIHDLTFEHYPAQVQGRNQRYLSRFVPKALARADHFIAVSEYTKRDIHERYGTPLDRISVVVPGVDLERYQPGIATDAVRAKLGLPAKYFLRVSTVEPRKNDLTLIAAYRALPDAIKREYALVISGKIGWNVADVQEEIRRGDPAGTIIHTNYVADADMPALYAGATAFVLASHYEGFGMPALEAMACGTPVLVSRTSSHPEVVEGAGLMVAPDDVAGFTAGMQRLATDSQLRSELSRQGRERALTFSWDNSGRQLKAVIEQVLGQ
jgi:glycosyltransferase involved in cell wall biosynthesis